MHKGRRSVAAEGVGEFPPTVDGPTIFLQGTGKAVAYANLRVRPGVMGGLYVSVISPTFDPSINVEGACMAVSSAYLDERPLDTECLTAGIESPAVNIARGLKPAFGINSAIVKISSAHLRVGAFSIAALPFTFSSPAFDLPHYH